MSTSFPKRAVISVDEMLSVERKVLTLTKMAPPTQEALQSKQKTFEGDLSDEFAIVSVRSQMMTENVMAFVNIKEKTAEEAKK
ncbi:hypothetical protein MAR_033319, partial [Mya arenaria]